MANGHARTTGAITRTATLGGKKYTLSAFSLGVLPEMEAYIISKREDPIPWATRACMVAPSEQHKVIWEVAMEKSIRARSVTEQEMDEFRRTSIGNAWLFWVACRKNHPEVDSVEKALEIIGTATEEEQELMNSEVLVASGEADLGNSTGLPATAAVAAKDQPAGQ